MNVLLITCSSNSPDDDQAQAGLMPIGLGYIAAYIQKHSNHNINIIDVRHENYGINRLLAYIKKNNINVLGVSTVITNYLFCKELSKTIKNNLPEVALIYGGALATALPEIFLQDCNAYTVIRGAGETAFLDVINNLDSY